MKPSPSISVPNRRVPRSLIAAVLSFGLCLPLLVADTAQGLVHYDAGRLQIMGIQLLQDADDESLYYYLPQFPRLATRDDGTFELLCLKYVGAERQPGGGLFHALVAFDLPEEVLEDLQKELEEQLPGARLAGPVPLMQAADDAEGTGSFEVVSAVLSDQGEGGFTRSMVTSGRAPLMPGSRAVVAALLEPAGATLLWDSFSGATSDVSVAINAYYEAKVEGYNAKVRAEVDTLYTHFSRVSNVQSNYTKRQLRKIVDELENTGDLQVEVFDRSESLGLDAKQMDGVLQIVTDKLVELMFDAETGWAKEPPRETAVEANQIQGRQKRGWFSRVFGGAQNTKYFSDDQYVLKRRRDVRRNVFTMDLSKSSTIKVPVSTAGNMRGLFDALGDDPQYFRIVDTADPAFERRDVHFQVDGGYVDAFDSVLNSVAINFRKVYGDERADFTDSLIFDSSLTEGGPMVKHVSFPRLGLDTVDWTAFEYQVVWNLRDGPQQRSPRNGWTQSLDAAVPLVPPFTKREVEIDADRTFFADSGYATAVVEFAVLLAGKPKLERKATLRAGDAESTNRVVLYHDRDEQVAYRVTWHGRAGKKVGALEVLESDYLFLVPPEPVETESESEPGSETGSGP